MVKCCARKRTKNSPDRAIATFLPIEEKRKRIENVFALQKLRKHHVFMDIVFPLNSLQ